MTTGITHSLEGTDTTRPAAGHSWLMAEGIGTLGTRLSFMAIAWSLLAGSMDWVMAGLVLTVQAAAYVLSCPVSERLLQRVAADQVSVTADLASAVAIASAAFVTGEAATMMVLVAAVGAARAASDLAKNVLSGAASVVDAPDGTGGDGRTAPPREWLTRPLFLLFGAAAGGVAAWLGPAGALWVVGMCFVASAAIVVSASTSGPVGLPPQPTSEQAPGETAELAPHVIGRGLLAALFVTSLSAYVGAVILVPVWTRDVLGSADALGLVGAALVFGALAGGAVINGLTTTPIRYLVLIAGFLAGGAAVAILTGVVATQLVALAVAALVGIAVASVTPIVSLAVPPWVPVALRTRAAALAAMATGLAVVPGTFAAGWIAQRAALPVAVAVAGATYLVAMFIPVLGYRTWQRVRPAEPEPVPILRRTPPLSARLSVTLAYADGRWLVELRRGRALLGKRYLVKPADALNMLAQLDVPALNQKVEEALTSDKTEAVRQVDRIRAELAELEAKLEGLTEMVDLSDGGKDRLG